MERSLNACAGWRHLAPGDLGGDEHHAHGFCPVDCYVPYDHKAVKVAGAAEHVGFVAGCIRDDEASWKIQYLDLSQVTRDVLVRKEAPAAGVMSRT